MVKEDMTFNRADHFPQQLWCLFSIEAAINATGELIPRSGVGSTQGPDLLSIPPLMESGREPD